VSTCFGWLAHLAAIETFALSFDLHIPELYLGRKALWLLED
jgi:hypothetical protein